MSKQAGGTGVLQKILSSLNKRLPRVVGKSLTEAKRRFDRLGQAPDQERVFIEQGLRSLLERVLQAVAGEKIDLADWDRSIAVFSENLARLGYPLLEILGCLQIIKETCRATLKDVLTEEPKLSARALLDFDIEMSRAFDRIQLGVVGPFLNLQDNIIQAQQAFLKHKFSSLFKLVEAISNNLDIQEFCEILLDYVCRFYDVKVSGVFLLDEKAKELYPQHVTGLSRRFKSQQRYRAAAEPFLACLREGRALSRQDQPFRAEDLTGPVPEPDPASGQATVSSLYAPMVGRQGTYGVVSVHCLKARQFRESEVQQLETLARIVAVALENARFYQNLAEEKGKLDAIVNSISDGLILIDFHEEIVFINEQAARYLRQPTYRLLGDSATVIPNRLLANARDPHTIQSMYLRALNNIMDYPVLDCTLYRPKIIDIRILLFPVHDRNQHMIGHGVIIKDISHEKEISRMKSEFAAIASHTMRTPMTSILGFASLLIEKHLPEETQKKYIQSIYRESQRLTRIFNDMLDLANIEAGQISLKLVPLGVKELIKDAVQELQTHYQRAVETQTGTKPLPRLIGDQQKLLQALTNVLINAAKFTSGKIRLRARKTGSVSFRVGWQHSRVNLDVPGMFPAILCTVEDSGDGIPTDELDSIFEPFHKIVSKGNWNEGSGLGLTIVRYIVEAHGGKIWVESARGKGSVFSILLPLELASPERTIGRLVT